MTPLTDLLTRLEGAREEIARIIHPRALRTAPEWRREPWCRDDEDAAGEVQYYEPERNVALSKADSIIALLRSLLEGEGRAA